MTVNKKGGIGLDEVVPLLIFIVVAAAFYLLFSSLHSSTEEQKKTDVESQLLTSQMEKELVLFLQSPAERDSTMADAIIADYYKKDFTAVSAQAAAYFSNKKFSYPYDDWDILVRTLDEPPRSIRAQAIPAALARKEVATAYLPLVHEYAVLEVKLYLHQTNRRQP